MGRVSGSRVATLGCAVAMLAGLAGCGRGRAAYVTQFPRWDYGSYHRVAVLPGRASTPQADREAGVLADRLTSLLAQNGAFTVLSRGELREVFAEQDLSRLADAANEGTALPEGRIEIAQALVATKITDYKLIAEREQQVIPHYAVDSRGRLLLDRAGRPIVAGQETVWIYRHGAEVEGSVRVIDAATGRILLSHSARVAPKPRTSRNQPPSRTPEQIASEAVAELAVEFYKAVAPTRTKVKLKGDMLVVATDYFEGQYETAKKLPRSAQDFLLAVRNLPEQCERNSFRVAIFEREGRTSLFEQEFVWSGSSGPEGVAFRVPMETLTRTGATKFVAKLYSGSDPQPVLVRDFELESAR